MNFAAVKHSSGVRDSCRPRGRILGVDLAPIRLKEWHLRCCTKRFCPSAPYRYCAAVSTCHDRFAWRQSKSKPLQSPQALSQEGFPAHLEPCHRYTNAPRLTMTGMVPFPGSLSLHAWAQRLPRLWSKLSKDIITLKNQYVWHQTNLKLTWLFIWRCHRIELEMTGYKVLKCPLSSLANP